MSRRAISNGSRAWFVPKYTDLISYHLYIHVQVQEGALRLEAAEQRIDEQAALRQSAEQHYEQMLRQRNERVKELSREVRCIMIDLSSIHASSDPAE